MRVSHVAVAGLAATLLASCGGGGSDGGNGGGGGGTPLPTLAVTLGSPNQTVTVAEGGSATFNFTASYTGTSTQSIIPNVVIDAERYRLVGTPTASGTTYTVNLETIPFSPGGLTNSIVIFRLCADTACTRVYPGSTVGHTVNLDIQVRDWETAQRLSGHRGYVDVNYRREDIIRRWEYTAPTGSQVGAAAATRRGVFLTERASDGRYYALAINSATGARDWRVDLGTNVHSDPAYHNGTVYYTSSSPTGSRSTVAINAITGAVASLPAYNAPAGAMNQPVPYMNALFFIAGSNGMVANAYNLLNGSFAWQRDFGGVITNGAALAVDDASVYAFAGPTIEVLSRTTGTPTASLANPDFAGGTGYAAAPILDPAGRLYAFTLSKAYTDASPIAAWSLANGSRLWTSATGYSAYPALGQSLLFAINPAQRRVDALQPDTGAVVYSIAIPGTGALSGSVVSTRSHLFVSTATDTYAFNLSSATRAQEWTAAVGGRLAITPDNQLIISNGARVTSYRLW